MLQPLVENAITHGFDDSGRSGDINISATQEKDVLLISVENTGLSLDPEKLSRINKMLQAIASDPNLREIPMNVTSDGRLKGSHGMALRNIQQRIRLLYGPGWGLRLASKQNLTTVTLRLPLEITEPKLDLFISQTSSL